MSEFTGVDARGAAYAILAPVLLMLSLLCMVGFLTLLFAPTTGTGVVVIAVALVLTALVSWRVKHGSWRGELPPQGPRQLMHGGAACLILLIMGLPLFLRIHTVVSPAALALLGSSLAAMIGAGLAGQRATHRPPGTNDSLR